MPLAISADCADDDRHFSFFVRKPTRNRSSGVAVCFWVWHRTDWFPLLASLLTLGGVFRLAVLSIRGCRGRAQGAAAGVD